MLLLAPRACVILLCQKVRLGFLGWIVDLGAFENILSQGWKKPCFF
jgi:hypothetical protein